MKEKIVLVGAGAWGTAIANLIAVNNHEICAISDINEIAEEINQKHTHGALKDITLESNLRASTNLEAEAKEADEIFIVVPSNVVLPILKNLAKLDLKENCGFVFCTKGLEHSSLRFFHEIFTETFPKRNYAVLSGPNFAIEVAAKTPTITNIASKNQDFAQKICQLLENDFFKPTPIKEVLVAEISSVIKNIMAISCGICDGLDLGENVKAALIVKGVQEINLLAKALGEEAPNTENAAGFGDIFLTCSTAKSRNNSLGKALGQGQKYQDLKQQKTYEGAINANSIAKLAKKLDLELNLCLTIDEILQDGFNTSEIKAKIIKTALS